jgi:hypothetical protein
MRHSQDLDQSNALFLRSVVRTFVVCLEKSSLAVAVGEFDYLVLVIALLDFAIKVFRSIVKLSYAELDPLG